MFRSVKTRFDLSHPSLQRRVLQKAALSFFKLLFGGNGPIILDKSTKHTMQKTAPIWISVAFLALLCACSHTVPYYRDGKAPEIPAYPVEEVQQRILLIGDAGEPQASEPSLQGLQAWALQIPARTLVIFLGDNIYPAGLPSANAPNRPEAERRLTAQIDAVLTSGARGLFVPGNHDWERGGKGGLQAVIRQQQFVIEKMNDSLAFLPHNGCPGPVAVDLPSIRIIVLDTQWWLQENGKPSGNCPYGDTSAVLSALKKLLITEDGRPVMIVAHHPLHSHGPHGGFFDWRDHLFPLTRLVSWLWIPTPVIGSLYPIYRTYIHRSNQELIGPLNKAMRRQLGRVLATHPPLIYAAGHDHSLQVLDGGEDAKYILISGAGSVKKLTSVHHGDDTEFSYLHSGFMVVDILEDGTIYLQVIAAGEQKVVFAMRLYPE